MTPDHDPKESKGGSPEALFAAWVEANERGEEVEFDALLEAHPQQSAALREMHSDWSLFAPLLDGAVPGSISGEEPGRPLATGSVGDEGAPLSDELLDRLGIRLPESGRYRFRSVIGRGGGGVVIKVWDAKLQRPLAMKVVLGRGEVRPSGDTPPIDAAVLTRFVDEARIASQLDHPGIVPVHELGTDASGRAFFTMRLVRGEDLGKVFERARGGDPQWSQTRLIEVLVRVCEAVGYAHGKGVLHRDLKPANVMLGRHGEVHVMDWGLARTATVRAEPHRSGVHTVRAEERERTPDSPLLTGFGAAVGTPAYMSPEQAGGELERVDARSDVYAIGAMLYELLAGEPPYVPRGAALNPALVLIRVVEGPPLPLAVVAPSAPEELVAICERSMARETERRYADVEALARDLRAFLEGRVVAAFESGSWPETCKWIRRNRPLAGALAGVLLALVTGLLVTAHYKGEAEGRARHLAVKEREALDAGSAAEAARTLAEERKTEVEVMLYSASIAAAAHAMSTGDYSTMRRFLDDAPSSMRHIEWYLLDAQSDTSLVSYEREVEGSTGTARFSSDGSRVIATDVEPSIWDTDTGNLLDVLRGHCSPVSAALFSPDDMRIVTASLDGEVRLWDWNGTSSSLQGVLGQPRGTNVRVSFADGGAAVLVWTPRLVEVWNADSATLRHVYAAPPQVSGVHANGDGSLFVCSDEIGAVAVYDSLSGTPIASWSTRLSGAMDLEFSADGRIIAASADGKTLLLEAFSGGIARDFDGVKAHRGLSDDASVLLMSHEYPRDSTWRIIEAATGNELWTFTQEGSGTHWLSPDGSQIITVDIVRPPLVRSSRRTQRLQGITGWADIDWSSDSKHVLTQAIGGRTKLWDPTRVAGYTELRMPERSCIAAVGGADAPRIVCFGKPSNEAESTGHVLAPVRVWDGRTLELLAETSIDIRVSSHFQEAVYSDALDLCAVVTSEEVIVFDPLQCRVVSRVNVPGARTGSFRPHSSILEVEDETLLYEVDAMHGRVLGRVPARVRHPDEVVSANDFLMARPNSTVMSMPADIELYERDPRRLVQVMKGHTGGVVSLTFTRDSARLLSCGRDGTMRIWDTSSGRELLRLVADDFGINNMFMVMSSCIVSLESHALIAKKSIFGRLGCFSLAPEGTRLKWRQEEQRLRPSATAWIASARESEPDLSRVVQRARAASTLGAAMRRAVLNEITREACREIAAEPSTGR